MDRDNEVERLMSFAKLEKGEHLPKVQRLYFDKGMDDSTYKLLELNPAVLNQLKEGSQ